MKAGIVAVRRKAPPPPAPVVYDWTGFYIGAMSAARAAIPR